MHEMKLHEVVTPDTGRLDTQVVRVPGGWVYRFFTQYFPERDPEGRGQANYRSESVFVPYNNEFKTK